MNTVSASTVAGLISAAIATVAAVSAAKSATEAKRAAAAAAAANARAAPANARAAPGAHNAAQDVEVPRVEISINQGLGWQFILGMGLITTAWAYSAPGFGSDLGSDLKVAATYIKDGMVAVKEGFIGFKATHYV